MNDAVRFVLVILILDIVMIISLRQVLYDFLIGNCSKIGVRNIRENLSLQDRIRMDYIEQYIREDTEKKSFRKHYRFYGFKCFAAPVLFAAVLFCAVTGWYTKYIIFIYAGYVIIPGVIIGITEWDPIQKCTVHAMKKHPFKQGKKKRNRKRIQ